MQTTNPTIPFASVRSSRDVSLVAFAVAVLGAFVLSAGAFLPRLSSPEASAQTMAAATVPATAIASR